MDFVALAESITPFSVAEFFLKILLLVLVFFITLLVHEMGHFFAARLFGMPVKSVEIGRGRRIYDRADRRGTRWCVRAVPLGAHVNLDTGKDGFFTRPYWQRALTIAAGPLVNLMLPFILIAGFYIAIGQPSTPPVIAGVQKGLAAERVGLMPGDRFLSIDGRPVQNLRDIWQQVYEREPVEGIYKIRRGAEEFEIKIKPDWIKYLDDDRIERSHARFGIFWDHNPFKIKAVRGINGVDVKNKSELALETIAKNFDRPSIIDVRGPFEQPCLYSFVLSSTTNANIVDKKHRDYKLVYFGRERGNFYLRQDFTTQIGDAFDYTYKKIGKIILLPLQILPPDPEVLTDPDQARGGDKIVTNYVYSFIHNLAVFSILVGLINLLPLPYLDGGHILVQGIESVRKKPMAGGSKVMLFGALFLLFYLSVLFANIGKLPGYIDSRAKKVHEFMDKDN